MMDFKYLNYVMNLPVNSTLRGEVIYERRKQKKDGYSELSNKDVVDISREAEAFLRKYISPLKDYLSNIVNISDDMFEEDITCGQYFVKLCKLGNITSNKEAMELIRMQKDKYNVKKH